MTRLVPASRETLLGFFERLLKVTPSCGSFNNTPVIALPDDLSRVDPVWAIYDRWKAVRDARERGLCTPETDAVLAAYALVQE